jgi:membrane-associated protein
MILLFETSGLIEWGGFLIIALLVFAETGLLLGLVIPGGESLVFTAGLLVSTGSLDVSITVLLITLVLAGFAGDISGFFIGRRIGRKLYNKKDTWYFKQQYLAMAKSFLEKHKRKSLIIGKFFPVIRPFSPVISGTSAMRPTVFISISAVSCFLYMSTFILAGYFLGRQYPQIRNYLGWILPFSILVALVPVVMQIRKHRKANKNQ